MRRKRLDRGIVLLLISTLVTLAIWVGLEIYWAYTRVSLPEGVETYLTPLTPSFDVKVLDKLEKRLQ